MHGVRQAAWKGAGRTSAESSQCHVQPPFEEDLPPASGQTSSSSKAPVSDSFVQVMPDNSTVIVQRGPGGSVKITKAPASTGQLSNISGGE